MNNKTEVSRLEGEGSNGEVKALNGGHSRPHKADHDLGTWGRRSLLMFRSIANATLGGGDDDGDESDESDAAWKMESLVGPTIGSVGRASIREAIHVQFSYFMVFEQRFWSSM